jgi:hypothetical protein
MEIGCTLKFFVQNPAGRGSFKISRHKWEYDIKMGCEELGCEDICTG